MDYKQKAQLTKAIDQDALKALVNAEIDELLADIRPGDPRNAELAVKASALRELLHNVETAYSVQESKPLNPTSFM